MSDDSKDRPILNLSGAGDSLILKIHRAAKRKGVSFEPGTFQRIQVFHDDWCAFLGGKGECDCDPDVKLVREPRT